MSVRAGLTAILTLGPAYGLQLHGELAARATHRGPINVGQIYSTLERLGAQGLIRSSGVTADGLPLHRLTSAGRTAAGEWLATPDISGLPEWTDMLDQVLIAASLDRDRALGLVDAFAVSWAALDSAFGSIGAGSTLAGSPLARSAAAHQAAAALRWLRDARDAIETGDLVRPYSPVKPRRGRRPLQAAG